MKTFPMDSMRTAGVQSCADLRSHKLIWFIAWFIAIYICIQIIAFWFSLDLTSTLAVYFPLILVSGKFIVSYRSGHRLWVIAYDSFREIISSHITYIWYKTYIIWYMIYLRNILKIIHDLDTFGSGNNTWCETFLTSLDRIWSWTRFWIFNSLSQGLFMSIEFMTGFFFNLIFLRPFLILATLFNTSVHAMTVTLVIFCLSRLSSYLCSRRQAINYGFQGSMIFKNAGLIHFRDS